MKPILVVCLLLPLAGCLDLIQGDEGEFARPLSTYDFNPPETYGDHVSGDDIEWPDFSGATLRILDHGAFAGFGPAASRFEQLTGAKVIHTPADDTGSALNRAIQGKDNPEFDVIYGIDNMLYVKAVDAGILQQYKPQFYQRVPDTSVFFGDDNVWFATPVDYGFIAPNIDFTHDEVRDRNTTLSNLFKLRDNADLFVTQDPRFSTPGLGFLISTIWVIGEDDAYTWQDYWAEMFQNDVLITKGWSEAYEIYFSGGYGTSLTGHVGEEDERPIVTSYTESPAYEHFFGRNRSDLARPLLDEQGSAVRQIQTMGILQGTENRGVAEAWIEFTLTDDFQELAAPENAMYPIVPTVSTFSTYQGVDPVEGTFAEVGFTYREIGDNLDAWIADWVDLCETYSCVS